MTKACSECKGLGSVPDYIPCATCGGRGFILDENKKPIDCPGGGCKWGKVETGDFVICLNCGGTGKEPQF